MWVAEERSSDSEFQFLEGLACCFLGLEAHSQLQSSKEMKRTGPLTTKETINKTNFWIRGAQVDFEETDTF